jgi:ABC-type uncharacterized transport system ATPase subunit
MSFSGELKGITKSYGTVHANQGVDLSIRAGTVHALIGENGAGKSTAMKILFGAIKPDSGTIRFGKTEVTGRSPHWGPEQAFQHGIGMVHQHFMLAGPETVHDNLVLGAESTRFGFRNRALERKMLEDLIKSTGLTVPLDRTVDSLPIGLQSRCEILKVLYRKARFLILDEPTAVLTPQETQDLLGTIRVLREHGNTILIVTHKLKEVMAVADEATVLRAGRTVATRKIAETNVAELSELMVGRRLQLPRAQRSVDSATAPVRVKLALGSSKLELRAGEITGIAGVEGSGQAGLIQALLDPVSVGHGLEIEILGRDARTYSPRDIRGLPIAVIPADRHQEGLVLPFSLTENLRLGRKQVQAHGLFGAATARERALLTEYDVRPNKPDLEVRALSGGNQQKLIVARELGDLSKESVVLAVHPTRGVDLGAIEFIHGRLLEAARNGAAVLLISSELDELMALSHRIGVMYHGAITDWFEGPPYDEKPIGLAMLSGHSKEGPTS